MTIDEKDGGVSDDAILDDVFASDRDRGADDAAPTPEPTPKADTEEVEAQDKDGESKRYRDPENGRFVPLTELKTERTKRQEEARLRAEAEQRALSAEAALNEARRYADQFQRGQHQPQQQQRQVEEEPDPFVDPQGYRTFIVNQAHRVALSERLNVSQMMAEDKYGAEKVSKAVDAAIKAGVALHFRDNSKHAYADIVAWHDKQEAFAEIGNDPSAFKANFEKQIREKVMAEQKGSASPQRFPGTLADASASGAQGQVLSDEAIVNDVFSSDRRRRG